MSLWAAARAMKPMTSPKLRGENQELALTYENEILQTHPMAKGRQNQLLSLKIRQMCRVVTMKKRMMNVMEAAWDGTYFQRQ